MEEFMEEFLVRQQQRDNETVQSLHEMASCLVKLTEIEERRLAIEEKKLEIEERKLAIQEILVRRN